MIMRTVIEGLERMVSNEIDRVMNEAKGVEEFGGADIVFAGGCSKKNCDVKYFIPTIASRDISWLIEELKKGNNDFNDPKYYEIIAKYSMDYVEKYESDFKEGKMTRGAYVSGLLLYILKALKGYLVMGEKKIKLKRFCIFVVKVVAIVIVLDLLYSFAQNGRYEMTQTESRTIVFDKWDKKFIIKRNNDYSPDVYEVKEDNIFDEIF